MSVLEAHKSYDFGIYRRDHDGVSYAVTAVAYVPQRADDDWQYIFLVQDPVGVRQAFDCFVCHHASPSREEADRIVADEVLPHIHALIESTTDIQVGTAAKGTHYYVILPTRAR